jgi:predicted dehydrogenase
MTERQEQVGIGIIGSGYMAVTYAEALARYTKGAQLSAIAMGTRAPALATEYSVACESSAESLLARADVDGVIVTLPTRFHREQAEKAAAAGRHVLVEKPMAASVADCDAMIAACTKAGVNLAVVKTQRYRDLLMEVKRLVATGAIGPIRMMTVVDTFPETVAHSVLIGKRWILEPENGGLFYDMASHVADFMLWLTESKPKQVFAQIPQFSSPPPRTDGEAPFRSETLMAQIGFENGVTAQYMTSPDVPLPEHPSGRFHFQIVGAVGMMDFKGFEYLDVTRNGAWERTITSPRFDVWRDVKAPERMHPHVGVAQEFVDSIRERRHPRVAGEEGRAAIELCQACRASATSGRVVTFPFTEEAEQ